MSSHAPLLSPSAARTGDMRLLAQSLRRRQCVCNVLLFRSGCGTTHKIEPELGSIRELIVCTVHCFALLALL